jgi:succinyl-diaminopimelate desuccinylase
MITINQDLLVDLSRRLIAIDTVDPPGNERAAAQLVADTLADEGIEHQLQEIAPNRANLVARIRGSGEKPGLVFSAHFDTISVNAAEWTVPPFSAEIRDGRLYGRGATDMKAALAAMVASAIALKRSGVPLAGDLILAFTAAENSSCLGAKHLADSGVLAGAGALLISEPSSLKVFIAEKGALWLRATASGVYGHNAFSEDRTGDRGNAIVRMAEFLMQVRELRLAASPHAYLGPPTVNVGLIRGGISMPLIPPSCSADIDVRMVPGMGVEAVLGAFRAAAGPHVSVELLDFKPPVTTPADHPFVQLCTETCEQVMGAPPAVEGVPYYTDGSILAPALDIPMVIIGPGEVGRSGSVDEYVELDKLARSADIFAGIARRYLS